MSESFDTVEQSLLNHHSLEFHKKIALKLFKQGAAKALRLVPIEELELSTRSHNCLKEAKVNTIGELTKLRRQQLQFIPSLGVKSQREIIEVMAYRGIFLEP